MRKKQTTLNIVIGSLSLVITQLLAFILRTVFIYTLGSDYLGINGLFTNILSLLSLAELGVSSAITFHLYKPLANNNEYKISALMNLYKKMYTRIGIVVFVLGMLIMPFLPVFIKDMPDISNLYLIYFLFLVNTSISYFFSYNYSLLIADQKQYKGVIITQKITFIKTAAQLIVLLVFKNYLLYLIINIIGTFINNYLISKSAEKEYSYIKEMRSAKLEKNELKEVYKYISAMFASKIGTIIVFNTDNLLISTYIGVFYVGITSNYYLIIQMINTFVGQIVSGLTASLGNLNSEDNLVNSFRFYKITNFVMFAVYTLCTILLINLFNPFIELWVGNKYLLEYSIVCLIVINFYLTGLRKANLLFINTMGLQWEMRKKPIIEAILNLILSIALINYLGLAGVFLGTLITTLLCCTFYEPYLLSKHGLKFNYFNNICELFKQFTVSGLCYLATNILLDNMVLTGFFGLIINGIITGAMTSLIILLFYFKTNEVKYFKDLLINLLKRKVKSS